MCQMCQMMFMRRTLRASLRARVYLQHGSMFTYLPVWRAFYGRTQKAKHHVIHRGILISIEGWLISWRILAAVQAPVVPATNRNESVCCGDRLPPLVQEVEVIDAFLVHWCRWRIIINGQVSLVSFSILTKLSDCQLVCTTVSTGIAWMLYVFVDIYFWVS